MGYLQIGDDKIKIVDTIWDDNLRKDGKVFAQQANIGLDSTSIDSDWLFHLQLSQNPWKESRQTNLSQPFRDQSALVAL